MTAKRSKPFKCAKLVSFCAYYEELDRKITIVLFIRKYYYNIYNELVLFLP